MSQTRKAAAIVVGCGIVRQFNISFQPSFVVYGPGPASQNTTTAAEHGAKEHHQDSFHVMPFPLIASVVNDRGEYLKKRCGVLFYSSSEI